MAYTIRKLSAAAEKELNSFIKKDYDIKTKTKAIEKILEERNSLVLKSKQLEKTIQENHDLKEKLVNIKSAISFIKGFK
jgi:hypothetical protein